MVNSINVNDRIGDFINRLKNASAVNKNKVSVPHTNLLQSIAETLKKAGYLSSVTKTGKGVTKTLEVELAKPIEKTIRVSKPSRRLYTGAKTAPAGKGGRGITVLSTPKGIMSSVDAKEQHVGGEILFTIV